MFNITSKSNRTISHYVISSFVFSSLLFFSACNNTIVQNLDQNKTGNKDTGNKDTGNKGTDKGADDKIKQGKLVDSGIEGVYYNTNSRSGVTDSSGSFSYSSRDKTINFKVGNLSIVKDFALSKLNSDGIILPSDIVGADRGNISDEKIVKLLRVLQSLDDDGDASNGILITDNIKGLLGEDISIIDASTSKLKSMVENAKKTFKSEEEVKRHYEITLNDMGIATKSAPFITVWQTNSTDNNITIPINPDYKDDYNYKVDWGDGSIENNINDNITHVYSNVGDHTVKISGAFPAMRMVIKNNIPLIDEERKNNAKQLQKVTQWGDIEWRSFNKTFALCNNLDVNAIDTPNLSDVNSTRGMFWDASALKGNEYFNKWDVSNITTMESMFQQATNFNQPLTNWNVSNVTNMKLMFNFAESFNQPLNSWNVSNVTNMFAMISSASSFNQPLNNWNVSKVTDMTFMFAGARAFSDQNLSSWDISSVESGKNGNFIDGAGDRNIQPNWN